MIHRLVPALLPCLLPHLYIVLIYTLLTYNPTRPSSVYVPTSAQYLSSAGLYSHRSQFPTPRTAQGTASMPAEPNHTGFEDHGDHYPSGAAGQPLSQPFQTSSPQPRCYEILHLDDQQAQPCGQDQRSMSVAACPSQRYFGKYAVLQCLQPPHAASE